MHHMNTPLPAQERLFPDQKPIRVTVPVTPEVQAAFQRLAAASGMSTGRAMGDWLADTLDGVLAMADLLEQARRSPKRAVREMHALALGLSDMTMELMQTMRQGPAEGAPLRGEVAGQAARRTASAPESPEPFPPRTVIRGGKSQKRPKTGGKP